MAIRNKLKIPDDGKEIEGDSSSEDESVEPAPKTKAEDKRKSFETEALVRATSFMKSEDASKFKPKSKDDDKRQSFEAEALVRATSFMESEDANKYKPPARKPVIGGSSDGVDSARRPKAIQSRIQAFINREPSPPPRRSATGYGFYTDQAQRQQDDENSIDIKENNNGTSGQIDLVKPLKSNLTEERFGDKAPPPPSKPKHLKSFRKA